MTRIALLLVVAACGSKEGSTSNHAVGTYVGGGSIFGADSCTYVGDAGVFAPGLSDNTPSTTAASGPRFVIAPGKLTKTCGDAKTAITAVTPTGAAITGPSKVKKGATSEAFNANLVANSKTLDGEANLAWQLGKDCENRATFSSVLGAQDTGGKDRHRTLVTTGAGTCTVIVTATTGSSLFESFKPQAFQAEKLVTIE
ncbi:MAG: hypothetical protein H0T89_07730 [Deltaproteobacteria bacterium]|nr:hypothetical protein [Deltaproteobacteria bacterium]MDQ3301407.1 hypothetical protein [Myxococcota bacterium]